MAKTLRRIYRSYWSILYQRLALSFVLLLAGVGVIVEGHRLGLSVWGCWLPGFGYILGAGLMVHVAYKSWRLDHG